jgi:AcrR family transcriptional regulator
VTSTTTSDTRTLLVDTAITLWAARGIDAVSLREIGLAAGQKNTGVINYYFGDREGLLIAVGSRFAELHPDFEERASAHLPTRRPAPARQVAGALVRPMAEMAVIHPDYMQLTTRMFSDLGRARYLIDLPAARWFRRIEGLINERFGIEPGSRQWQFAISLTMHGVAEHARQMREAEAADDPGFVDALVDAVAAVLSSRRA